MKKLIYLLGLIITIGFTACENNSDGEIKPNEAIQTAFSLKYPDAQKVRWHKLSTYYVATFTTDNESADMHAWYNVTGDLQMEEAEILYSELPLAVRTAFSSSKYSNWEIDEIDRITRGAIDTIYAIEVEKEEEEAELIYSTDGILVSITFDNDNDDEYDDENMILPNGEIPTEIQSYLNTNYNGCRILDIELEDDGTIEVDILTADKIKLEIVFSSTYVWIQSKQEINISDIPANIKSAFDQSEYRLYVIEKVTKITTTDSTYYTIEAEDDKLDKEVTLKITEDGKITVLEEDND